MRAMTYNILINSYSDISIRGGQIRYTVLPVVDIAVFLTTFFLQELLSIFALCAAPFSTLYSKVLQPLFNILQQSVAGYPGLYLFWKRCKFRGGIAAELLSVPSISEGCNNTVNSNKIITI